MTLAYEAITNKTPFTQKVMRNVFHDLRTAGSKEQGVSQSICIHKLTFGDDAFSQHSFNFQTRT